MTTLVCDIPQKLNARLEKLAQQANLPKERFVRKTLEQATRPSRPQSNAFKLVKNLCGSLAGPSDLATNPKYFSAGSIS
jgi:hypothetical protein